MSQDLHMLRDGVRATPTYLVSGAATPVVDLGLRILHCSSEEEEADRQRANLQPSTTSVLMKNGRKGSRATSPGVDT